MSRKVKLVIHRGDRLVQVGECVVDPYESVTFVITDYAIVAELTESRAKEFTALVMDAVTD